MGFGVLRLGLRVLRLGFRVLGPGFRVRVWGFRVSYSGLWFRVWAWALALGLFAQKQSFFNEKLVQNWSKTGPKLIQKLIQGQGFKASK